MDKSSFPSLPREFATPIYAMTPRLLLKLEQLNIGGSHKTRSARWMITEAVNCGLLSPGKTILEKTGGNLGIGLAIEAARRGIAVELAVGLSFSARKKALLTRYGASLIGDDMLRRGLLPRDVIAYHLENQNAMGKFYVFLDQFSNNANLHAHLRETGGEIVQYIKSSNLGDEKLILVGGVGSGASISGVGWALKDAFPHVNVVAVQPEGCDIMQQVFVEHDLQGLAVGVKPTILRDDIIDNWASCSEKDALVAREWLLKTHGIFAGLSTGANIHIAHKMARTHPNDVIISFVYDSGESYE